MPDLSVSRYDMLMSTAKPTTPPASWLKDSIDPHWWQSDAGSVRKDYHPERRGWWFLPADKPDYMDYDIGPFRSRKAAMELAESQQRPDANAGTPAQFPQLAPAAQPHKEARIASLSAEYPA